MPRHDQRIGDYILHEVFRVDGIYDVWNATKVTIPSPVTLRIPVLPESRREPSVPADWEVELDDLEDYAPRPYTHEFGQLCPKCGGKDTRPVWDDCTPDRVNYGDYCRLCEYHFHLFSSTDAPTTSLNKSYGLPPTLLGLHFASSGRRLLQSEARSHSTVMPPDAGVLFMSPDARIFVRLEEKFIRFWDVSSGKELPYTINSPTPDCIPCIDPFLVFFPRWSELCARPQKEEIQ